MFLFKKNNIKLFLISTVIAVLLYGTVIFNPVFNNDTLYTPVGFGSTLVSGRWSLMLLEMFTKYFLLPVNIASINLILAIFLLVISGIIVCETMEIEDNALRILLILIMVSFPSIASIFLYSFTVFPYVISIFLVVTSVYIIKNNKKIMYLTPLFVSFSMGIYQLYISIFIALLVMLIYKRLIESKNDDEERWNKIFFDGLKYIGLIVASVLLYFVFLKIMLFVFNVKLTTYLNINEMGKFEIFAFPYIIKESYKLFFKILLNKNGFFFFSQSIKIAMLSLSVFILINIFFTLKNKKSNQNKLLLIFVTAILPISINSVRLMFGKSSYGISLSDFRLFYAFFTLFIIPILLLESKKNTESRKLYNFSKKLVYVFLSIIILNFVNLNNYSFVQQRKDNSLMTYQFNNIINEIEKIRTEKNEKVALIGNFPITDKHPIPLLDGYSNTGNGYSRSKYFSDIFNKNFRYATPNEVEEIIKTQEYKNMSIYPANGSIKIYKDYIIIKLSKEAK